MITDSFIKSLRDIMRNDHNVSGDAQRMEQIAWLLFLKVFDDREKEFEVLEKGYKSPISTELKWRNWAAPADGITGDALIKFVNENLLKTLKEIPVGESTDPRHLVVKQVIGATRNYMSEGVLLRQIVNHINELDLNLAADRHAMNDIYEKFLRELQDAGSAGEYYTPRPITNFIVEMIDPKIGETILDPACGTGGFLINTLELLKKQAGVGSDVRSYQKSVMGIESKPLPYILGVTSMLLHGIDIPTNITRRDSLARPTVNITDSERVDIIVANPPFGGHQKDGTEKNFPKLYQTKETADLFVYLMTQLLKTGGRAGIVLPESFLSGDGVKARLKEELMTKCNLHTIIRLPGGEFTPYAAPKVCLLFFDKGTPTKNVWFYELSLPGSVGKNGFTKTMPLKDDHLDPIRKWWKKREESPNAYKISIEEIKKRNWSLYIPNPNRPKDVDSVSVKELMIELHTSETIIGTVIQNLDRAFDISTSAQKKTTKGRNNTDALKQKNTPLEESLQKLEKKVLTLAVSGKLVSQDKKEGTGEELYKQIQTERSKQKKIKEFSPITDKEIPFEIPKTWKWVRLGEVTNYGNTDKYKNKKIENGTLILELEDLEKDGGKILSVIEYPQRKPQSEKNVFKKGDVLYGKLRPYLNKVVVANRDGLSSGELLPIRWYGEGSAEYLRFVLLSDYFSNYVSQRVYGMKMPRLGTDDGKKAYFPLPPLAEQKRIVAKVEEVMGLIRELKNTIKE